MLVCNFLVCILNKQLLEVLVCPESGGALEISPKKDELWCRASGLAYPIDNGIPVMLADKARKLSEEEKQGK